VAKLLDEVEEVGSVFPEHVKRHEISDALTTQSFVVTSWCGR